MNLKFFNSLKSRKYALSKIVFPVMLVSALFPTNCYANSNVSVEIDGDLVALHSENVDITIPKEEFINLISLEGDKIVIKDDGYSLEFDKSDLYVALVNNIEDISKKNKDERYNTWLVGYILGILFGGASVLAVTERHSKRK